MLIPLEDEDGRVSLLDDEVEYSLVFCNGGFISNSLILYAFRHREKRNNIAHYKCRVVVCKNDIADENIISIKSEVADLNSRYIGMNTEVTIVGESYSNIAEWLPKFVHDYYPHKIMINKLKIYIGTTKYRFSEIKTADEEVNKHIIYPYKDHWHHDALKGILVRDWDCINRLIVCEKPKEDKKFCTECPTCQKLKFDLRMIYAEHPEDKLVVERCKRIYRDIFGEKLKYMQPAYTERSGPMLLDPNKALTKIKPISMVRPAPTKENNNA